MGLFNNIIERKTDGSSTIVNYDIILSEYARKKDLANYLHKGRNKTNILHSDIDMGNNKITNLGTPEVPMIQFQKGFFINGYKNSLMIIALKVFLVILIQLRMRLRQSLLSNRKSTQEKSMSLQNEIAKVCEALLLNVSTVAAPIFFFVNENV